jgi:cyclopropane-fatty-acyl-phospholipid synthase
MSSGISTDNVHAQTTLVFLRDLLTDYHPRDFVLRLWEGTCWNPEPGVRPRYTLVLRHPGSLRAMLCPARTLTLCEAYLHDDFDIEGAIEPFWRLVQYLFASGKPVPLLGRKQLEARLASLPARQAVRHAPLVTDLQGAIHSPERDQQAVPPQYGTSNDFYALWLDQRMVYTCAYFTDPGQDLDTGQQQKLDHICRKLRLRPGERLLDIGCGWGGLVRHAARHYGVQALGVTITPEQARWAQECIRTEGLEASCEVRLGDYREIKRHAAFDKLVAVGFLEHVGEALYPAFFRQAWDLLRPGGAFLNHGIVLRATNPLPVGWTFIYRYVFPETELAPVSTTLQAAERAGWEVRDVESLREHDTLTLRHWLARLEAHAEEARRCLDDFTYRVFRLYLSCSAFGFTIGQPSIYQSLLVKPNNGLSGVPLTRSDWYA